MRETTSQGLSHGEIPWPMYVPGEAVSALSMDKQQPIIVIALLAQSTSQGHPDHPDGGSYAPTLSHLVPSPGQCGWSKVVTLLMNG